MQNTYTTLKAAQDDLKYLERLNKIEFAELLFPDAGTQEYTDMKWDSFNHNLIHFIWSCSYDKLQLMADFIDECKGASV